MYSRVVITGKAGGSGYNPRLTTNQPKNPTTTKAGSPPLGERSHGQQDWRL